MARRLQYFLSMIDPSATTTVFSAPVARPDPLYQSWQGSMKRATMRFDLNDRTAGPMPTFGSMVHETALAAHANTYAPAAQNVNTGESNVKPDIAYPESEDEFSFGDVIDMINPLQHLPVVGMIYRKLTGDVIKPMSNIIGGAIFGGPIGAVSGVVNAVAKSTTGKDLAENAFALAGFDITPDGGKKPDLVYAQAKPASAPSSEQLAAYETASAHKNFAARNISTQIWNA